MKRILWALCLYLVMGSAHGRIIIQYGAGFNDATPATPIGGNMGTTVGQQRTNLVRAVADLLEDTFAFDTDIILDVKFAPLLCNQSSAVLGQAGAAGNVMSNQYQLLYPLALARQPHIGYQGPGPDINMQLNSSVNGNPSCLSGSRWYYGLDYVTSNYQANLYSTVLHEFIHGLGFASLVGVKDPQGGSAPLDIFSRHLYANGKNFDQYSTQEREQLQNSVLPIFFNGPQTVAHSRHLTAGVYNFMPQIQAKLLSHFHENVAPDELMKPVSADTIGMGLAKYVLADLGWRLNTAGAGITLSPIADIVLNLPVSAPVNIPLDYRTHKITAAVQCTLTNPYRQLNVNASCNGKSLTLQLNNPPAGDYPNLTLTVSAQSGGQTYSASQNVHIRIQAPMTLTAAGEVLTAGNQPLWVANQAIPLFLTGAAGAAVKLTLNGQERADLWQNGQLLMPQSGEYAGIYQIEVWQNGRQVAAYKLLRTPKIFAKQDALVASAQGFAPQQYLYIEGMSLAALQGAQWTANGLTFGQAMSVQEAGNRYALNRVPVLTTPMVTTPSGVNVTLTTAQFFRTTPIQIVPSKPLWVRVLNQNRAPLAAANVYLKGLHPAINPHAQTNAKGVASMRALYQEQTVVISAQGFQQAQMQIPSNETEWTAVLAPVASPITIAGSIANANGSALPQVVVVMADGSRHDALVGMQQGVLRYEYQGDSAQNPQQICISHPGYQSQCLPYNPQNGVNFTLVEGESAAPAPQPAPAPVSSGGGDDGGGGGSADGWLWLMLLGAWRLRARRRL